MGSSLVISAPLTSPSLIMIQYALPLLALTTSVEAQNSISSCPIDSECIPIKTCAPIISQLSLAGTSGKPSRLNGDVVLPYPYEGEHFSYSDKNIPLLLRPFDGSEDVVLTLPPGYSTTDLKWLSVWCRDYQINFGHVTFPQELVL